MDWGFVSTEVLEVDTLIVPSISPDTIRRASPNLIGWSLRGGE